MPSASTAASRLRSNTAFRALARGGFAMSGVLHILIGGIAVTVAVGGNHGEADQSGALQQLSGNPAGLALLWVITVGLWALGLFYLVTAIIADDAAKDRVTDAAKGVAYLAVGLTSVRFALGGSTSSSGQTQGLSAKLLSVPAGVLLLVVLGLAVAAVGVYFGVKGIRQKFRDDLSVPSGPLGRGTVVTGVVGYVAKGVAVVIVGILFVVAAVTADPDKATGLDGALTSLAALPFGAVILLVVALGLVAYGVYCFFRARFARL
jgi:hypothetical protein